MKAIFVAVPPARDAEPVREFGSWTADLERMAAWLNSYGIGTVAMQSTGVYWFAVYDVLEKHGLKVFLVNASHTKNPPGRKTDVQESQWLMKLHTFGLLRNSFRPPEDNRHAIADDGSAFSGYRARFNLVLTGVPTYSGSESDTGLGRGPQQDFDMHGTDPSSGNHYVGGVAGLYVESSSNTFLSGGDYKRHNFEFRGTPCYRSNCTAM